MTSTHPPRVRTLISRGLGAALLAASLLLTSACGASPQAGAASSASSPASLTVVDDVNRTVHLAGPAQRAVVINSYGVEFVNAIGAGDRIIGTDKVSQQRLGYLGFSDSDIVAQSLTQLNYEAIATLDPDVVILPRNGSWEDAVTQLGKFGIPVVVATAWDYASFHKTVDLLGQVFGERDGATKLSDFYDGIFDLIEERVAGTEKVKVYWETGERYLTVLPGSGFHAIIEAANATNIFADGSVGSPSDNEGTVDPALLIDRDPQIIIHEFEPSATPTGDATFNDIFASIKASPGWDQITAVKNRQVYVTNGWATSGLAKALGALYVAKWAHPEKFTDIDPGSYLKTWVEDFQHTTLKDPSDYIRQIPA